MKDRLRACATAVATLGLGVVFFSACGAKTSLQGARLSGERDAGPEADASTDASDDRMVGPGDASTDAPMDRDGGMGDGGPRPDGGPVSRCRRDADCPGRRVCRLDETSPVLDLDPARLVCGARRGGRRTPGSRCLVDSDCDRGLCLVADRCVQACASDADCPDGQWCQREGLVRRGREALQYAGVCVDEVNLPRGVGFVRRRLAEPVPPVPEEGVPIDLPARDGAVLHGLWLRPDPFGGRQMLLWRLIDRFDDAVLFDTNLFVTEGASAPTPLTSVYPATMEPAPLLFVVPNGQASTSSPAGYRAWVEVSDMAQIDRTTTWRVGGGERIDIDFFYIGGVLRPRTDRDASVAITNVVREATRVLSARGLRIGSVRHHDVPGDARILYGYLDGADGETDVERLGEVFRMSAGLGRPSVPVFLVNGLGMAVGIAGGAPGPQGMHGTSQSGVALALAWLDLEGDPQEAAATLVHEVGHFLGLFHTTEQDGTVYEALPDTPECRIENDADGDGFVMAEECVGKGGDNVMFWVAAEVPQETLSPGQGRVLSSSMVAR